MTILHKSSFLLLALLTTLPAIAQQCAITSDMQTKDLAETRSLDLDKKWDDCWEDSGSVHKLKKQLRHKFITKLLCAKKIKAKCGEIDQLTTEKLRSKKGRFKKLKSHHACISKELCAKEICAEELRVNSICSPGDSKMHQLEVCQQFKGTVVFGSDTVYTLGTPLNFDTTLEDPNGNFSFAPTEYTAPISGTYILTLQIDQTNLQGADPILGSPVGNLEILVNGSIFRQTYTPFLTFSDNQFSTVSTLISLQAGDKIQTRYKVLVLTEAGITDYIGTVTLLGNGSAEDRSVLKIHYLSTDCSEPICEPCVIECKDEEHHHENHCNEHDDKNDHEHP